MAAGLAGLWRLAIGLLLVALLSGCMGVDLDDLNGKAPEIPPKLMSEMRAKGMRPESPVLIRIFKKESELELWKQDKSGRYALLKTWPICRWSGKLGPKTATGDRQAPEGFYHVSAGQLNPNSKFYLSFNLGYPNRLESALGYTGEALMVHGACSSSGCFAMSDAGILEIYALVHKALVGGQERFQVQSLPFRMTPENMAAHSADPHFPFWKTLKEGYDIFDVKRQVPKVSVCGGRYVFNRQFLSEPEDPLAACPPDTSLTDPLVAARQAADQVAMSSLIAGSNLSSFNAYPDGGMHPTFRSLLSRMGDEKLAAKTSRTRYPVSRPDAALADPYK